MQENDRSELNVYEIKETVDVNSGRQVVMLTRLEFEIPVIHPGDPEAFLENTKKVVFRGLAPVMTNQGPTQFPFIFPENFKTLKQCWDNFDEVAQNAIKQMQDEQRHKIIIPGRG